jgi:hypothetical protein
MDKGYKELIAFMTNWLSKFVTIENEQQDIEPPHEHYYFFSISETKYVLMICDGFALYECLENGKVHRPIWTPLENDFKGLELILKDLLFYEKKERNY